MKNIIPEMQHCMTRGSQMDHFLVIATKSILSEKVTTCTFSSILSYPLYDAYVDMSCLSLIGTVHR